eukprot:Clim_evm3s234 gene=Clim_evmTU3s234
MKAIMRFGRNKADGQKRPTSADDLGSLDIIEASNQERLEYFKQYANKVIPTKKNADSFKLHSTLGTGSFGRVYLAQDRDDGEFVALKVLRKSKVVKLKQVEHTLNEKNFLQGLKFPFIVDLKVSFKDNANLYMVLEYIPGGELFSYLRQSGRLPQDTVVFYTAQVAMVFEYLHSLNLVYRDLKPENLLLDANGYLKITDFGFVKMVTDRTWTLCGTPEYLAPEIILSKGYNQAVDWWALGILLYEMLCGYPPFYADQPLKIYEKILAGRIRYPPHVSNEARDLVRNLLQIDITKRYGNLRGGVKDIKRHPLFKTIDWTAIYNRADPAPYVPVVKGEGDRSNYDKYPEEPIAIALSDEHGEAFQTF